MAVESSRVADIYFKELSRPDTQIHKEGFDFLHRLITDVLETSTGVGSDSRLYNLLHNPNHEIAKFAAVKAVRHFLLKNEPKKVEALLAEAHNAFAKEEGSFNFFLSRVSQEVYAIALDQALTLIERIPDPEVKIRTWIDIAVNNHSNKAAAEALRDYREADNAKNVSVYTQRDLAGILARFYDFGNATLVADEIRNPIAAFKCYLYILSEMDREKGQLSERSKKALLDKAIKRAESEDDGAKRTSRKRGMVGYILKIKDRKFLLAWIDEVSSDSSIEKHILRSILTEEAVATLKNFPIRQLSLLFRNILHTSKALDDSEELSGLSIKLDGLGLENISDQIEDRFHDILIARIKNAFDKGQHDKVEEMIARLPKDRRIRLLSDLNSR